MTKAVYHTKNLSLAAYLLMQGMKLSVGRMTDRSPPQYMFTFDDPDGVGAEISKQFPSSESSRHDENVRFLKNFCRDCSENNRKNNKRQG